MGCLDRFFRFFQFGHHGLAREIINLVQDRLIVETERLHTDYLIRARPRYYDSFNIQLEGRRELIAALGDMLQKKISQENFACLSKLNKVQRLNYLGLLANDYVKLIENLTQGFQALQLTKQVYPNHRTDDDVYVYITVPPLFKDADNLDKNLGDLVESILQDIERPDFYPDLIV